MQTLSLADYIGLIGELPEPLPVLLEANQTKLFACEKEMCKGVSLWLQTLMLGQPLHPEVLDYAHCQPQAELSTALFKLVTGTYIKSELLQSEWDSPAQLWFLCELGRSRRQVERSGLLGYIPYQLGKRKWQEGARWLRENSEAFNLLNEFSSSEESQGGEYTPHLVPYGLLMLEAYSIAQADNDFKQDYYRPYWKAHRSFHSKIKRCPDLQFVHIDQDGVISITGGQGRLPK